MGDRTRWHNYLHLKLMVLDHFVSKSLIYGNRDVDICMYTVKVHPQKTHRVSPSIKIPHGFKTTTDTAVCA